MTENPNTQPETTEPETSGQDAEQVVRLPEELVAGALDRLAQPAIPDTREAFLARMGIDPEKMAAYETQYAQLRDQAITTLTTIARLDQPGYGQMDFAGFLGGALTSVAANLGSAEQLVAGRSGSWEADLVFRLVGGLDDGDLLWHRTEPVRIYLSVARLVNDTAWARGGIAAGQSGDLYDDELGQVYERHQALADDVYDDTAELAEEAAVQAKWAARYQGYAEQFTAAIQAAAAGITGLAVPVEITVSTGPSGEDDDYTTAHPSEWAGEPGYDPIASRLWTAALAAVPVPADWTQATGPASPDAPAAADGEVE